MSNGIPNAVAQFRSPESAAKPESSPASADGGRDAFFDNAKYLLIVLVAVAHAWELVESSRATKALYVLVYTFHMPAFIVISGYLSRTFAARPRQLRRLVGGIAVPYVVFETAYSLFKRYADDAHDHPISLLDPWLLTWFLAALFIWRLTTPLWQQLRHPLAVALTIAVLASVTPGIGGDLNLQRVLQFLPFFVLGLCLKPEHFRLLNRRAIRLAAIPLFAGALAFAYWAATRMRTEWFFRRSSAQEIGEPWWTGVVMTFALFACSLLLTAAFLAWVPRGRTWFTVLGAGTICGYLLHGFLTKGAQYSGLVDANAWLHDPAGKVVLTVVAAGAVTVLCTPPVRRVLRPVTEPDLAWAFRRDPAERTAKG
ncbi:acyltransferase family protein [Streptomyces sp. ISL-22]|uniref:acyltransferase family protein n=1 Tax=unclassified Streptomyces TaxID=2593676 RepID=UPI001BECA700|nr:MULTISPECIES: acyltransferase family protein [unclassified Streptomyces]MBT2420730.1 acyltransferase family protein [Streptomyces sp. ISL-24]MBT2437640.1 acyltransferase family protein [Streptomyces sp. ISL-22]